MIYDFHWLTGQAIHTQYDYIFKYTNILDITLLANKQEKEGVEMLLYS